MSLKYEISQDETFKKLNDRNVKDLYWLLFSNCPINNNHPELENIPFFPEEIMEEWKLDSTDYFLKLDERPDELNHFLNRPKNKRLGFYAEALLSFFFQTYSKVELLFQNYQIIENKKTLGEVDFVIKWKDRVLHIECAVKFYLCVHSKDINNLHNWIGPACKDDLGRKIAKVKEHQLPIISSLKHDDLLSFYEIESYLFLKGKLFVNQKVSCQWVSSSSLGEYAYLHTINDLNLNLLIKPFWLSIQSENTQSEYVSEFKKEALYKRAELVMKKELTPFFVVPKDWPFLDS